MFNKMGTLMNERGDDWPSALIPGSLPTNEYPNPNRSNTRKYSGRWYASDTEELYDKHIADGVKLSYKKEDFYYDLNSTGFRCDDFDTMDFTKKSIIYLGCSHTFGTGLPEEDCWPTIMHNKIQEEHNTTYNYINLGVPGGGVDWYLHFLPYFSKFNPAFIISATPEVTRMNWVTEGGWLMSITPSEVTELTQISKLPIAYRRRIATTYRRMLLEENHFEYRKEVIFANIASVAKILNSKLIIMDSETVNNPEGRPARNGNLRDSVISGYGYARDNRHYNNHHHTILAKIMMKKIKENK